MSRTPNTSNKQEQRRAPKIHPMVAARINIFTKAVPEIINAVNSSNVKQSKIQSDGKLLFKNSILDWVTNPESLANPATSKLASTAIHKAEPEIGKTIDAMPKPTAKSQGKIDLNQEILVDPHLFDVIAADSEADIEVMTAEAPISPISYKSDSDDDTADELQAKRLQRLSAEAKDLAITTEDSNGSLAKAA